VKKKAAPKAQLKVGTRVSDGVFIGTVMQRPRLGQVLISWDSHVMSYPVSKVRIIAEPAKKTVKAWVG